MKLFNLYWGGNNLSAGSPHQDDFLLVDSFGGNLSDEVLLKILRLDVGQSVHDQDGDRWERVE